jgi:NADH-quinone oxidoreductase subunit M
MGILTSSWALKCPLRRQSVGRFLIWPFMLLLALITIPIVFALLVAAAPTTAARPLALAGMLVSSAAAVVGTLQFPWQDSGSFHFSYIIPWLSQLGISLSVGADSVSMLLIALTALLGPVCVVASKTSITENLKTYYAWLLVLQAAMYGVFAARDVIMFYICFEFTLVPMFILINLFGSTNRKHASIKFFLYTFTGSVIALAGLVYVAWFHAHAPLSTDLFAAANTLGSAAVPPGTGIWTFDIETLAVTARSMPMTQQAWVLLALMCGFAVKVPLFPVHTWLPLAHTEAPTAGSVLLAGVLLKLGTYGIFRFVLPFVPAAMIEYAPFIAVLCIIGILYGGLICWVQTDVKKLVAYSSVAHLGFCVLGLVALNNTGIIGSILYMINHGLSTGALFLCIGMIYERYHTRSMKELGGLAAKMPIWSTFMVFFAMASVGLPGLNGFISEFMCLLGAFQASSAWGSASTAANGVMDSGLWGSAGASHIGSTAGNLGPWFAAIAGIGMIIAAMYLLLMVGKVVFGPLVEPHGHAGHGGHGSHGDHKNHGAHDSHAGVLPTDLNRREIGVLVPFAVLCVVLGVYPKPLLTVLEPPVTRTVQVISAARSAGIPMAVAPGTDATKVTTVLNSEVTAK